MAATSNARRSVRSVIKSTPKIKVFPLGPFDVYEEQSCEVPFESLTHKKGFNSKDNHKAAMKLHSIRLGGLVGTKSGVPGHLTYGTSSKDNLIMMSIGGSTTPAPPLNALTHTNQFKSLKIAIRTASVPTPVVTTRVPTPVVTEAEAMMEVPFFALTERRPRAGFKWKMAQSTIRRGGLVGDKTGGVGCIVYGSFEVEDHLQV